MRISDWSSDVCSSDLNAVLVLAGDIDLATAKAKVTRYFGDIPASASVAKMPAQIPQRKERTHAPLPDRVPQPRIYRAWNVPQTGTDDATRTEEHTSELQSLMRTSNSVFCLTQKKN